MLAECRLPRDLPLPVVDSIPEYDARLGDAAYWAPYVAAVLVRHGLPLAAPEVGAVGTFPTFLVGRYVVKLFGELFEGAICHEFDVLRDVATPAGPLDYSATPTLDHLARRLWALP